MQNARRLLLAGAAALVALAGAVLAFRNLIADFVLTRALAAAGFAAPSLEIASLSLDRARIERLSAGSGPSALEVAEIDIGFDPGALLRAQRVKTISIKGASVAIDRSPDGAVRIAGFALQSGQERKPLPFDALSLEDVEIGYRQGSDLIHMSVTGAFSDQDGGRFDASAAADQIAAPGARLTGAALTGAVVLNKDGAIDAQARARGAVETAFGKAEAIALEFGLSGGSWRAALAGEAQVQDIVARIRLNSARVPVAASAALAGIARVRSIAALTVAGGIDVAADGATWTVRAADGAALRVESDAGDRLEVLALAGAPLFSAGGDFGRAAMTARLTGAVAGEVALSAEKQNEALWSYALDATIGAQTIEAQTINAETTNARSTETKSIGAVELSRSSLIARGEARFDGATVTHIFADGAVKGALQRAVIGRLVIHDAPIAASFHADIDLGEKSVRIASRDGACAALERVRVEIPTEASEASLLRARLCPTDRAMLVHSWRAEPRTEFAALISADRASYRLGATSVAGAPPNIRVAGAYEPQAHVTRVEGSISGGALTLNDSIIASAMDGSFVSRLTDAGLSGEASLARVVIAQASSPEQIAPIAAAGEARLQSDIFSFDFRAQTLRRERLGAGRVRHDVASGRGALEFSTGALVFSPDGLQIAALLPSLRGQIGRATGSAGAEARASWTKRPEEFSSSGVVSFDALSFRGPGVAVSQTAGVSGAIEFSSLAPLRTAGPQSISIGLIDLGALKLEGGALLFEAPGDDTFKLIKGEFPWFGGRIGAYDASASFDGAQAQFDLRADNVDLGEMLRFLDIEGLSGEGRVEGVLPLKFQAGKAAIVDGRMRAAGPGVVRYSGKAAEAAAAARPETKLAFDILRELHFETLTVVINGPLEGDLGFDLLFEGANAVTVSERAVTSPVIYRIRIEAPLLAMIDQAQVSADWRLQLERAGVAPGRSVEDP